MEIPESDIHALEELAQRPADVWRFQVENMPDLMAKVDQMLRAGMSPEWICNRGEYLTLPIEVQTVFINALHWRQAELRNL